MSTYSMHGSLMIARAEAFAIAAHAAVDQRRKYTNEPYIVHPRAVVGIVQACHAHVWQQVVVAWLHDTVEDTGVTNEDIVSVFGRDIAFGVWNLTNVDKTAGNRAARHQMNCDRLKDAPNWAKTVKVADIYDNAASIAKYDPAYAPQYLKEKEDAMLSLRGADDILWQLTMDLILKQKEELVLEA